MSAQNLRYSADGAAAKIALISSGVQKLFIDFLIRGRLTNSNGLLSVLKILCENENMAL